MRFEASSGCYRGFERLVVYLSRSSMPIQFFGTKFHSIPIDETQKGHVYYLCQSFRVRVPLERVKIFAKDIEISHSKLVPPR